ncbi:hypothetical protein PIB30_057596, partial [Stylosanthes scabra]|nr:hypothetical protein [Stylosanthes scabra]
VHANTMATDTSVHTTLHKEPFLYSYDNYCCMQTPLMEYDDPNFLVDPKHMILAYTREFELSSRIVYLFVGDKPCSNIIVYRMLYERLPKTLK